MLRDEPIGGSPRAAPGAGEGGPPVLRADQLTKSFHRGIGPMRRTVEVLRGASIAVSSGELVGLVGENGSGKSTLMKIIVGMLDSDGGTVERTGKLGYCPQLPLLWEKLTVREHFELFARAYRLTDEDLAAARGRLLAELRYERYVDYRVEELSGGTGQKLNLSLALMHDPDLLLLDEPYSGFDWETYERFWAMSAALSRDGMDDRVRGARREGPQERPGAGAAVPRCAARPVHGRLDIDPVCRMALGEDRDVGSLVYHGRRFRFCSLECARQFAAEPERFAGGR